MKGKDRESPRGVSRMVVVAALAAALFVAGVQAGRPEVIAKVEPAVVAIGTFLKTRRPPSIIRGTGFVVGDGRQVLTNSHVLPSTSSMKPFEQLSVFYGQGDRTRRLAARVVARDAEHDLALLRIEGAALPVLALADGALPRVGEEYLFTGYPIGMVLGLYPVTHHAMVSSITPIAIPASTGGELSPARIRRLKNRFMVIQLDGTAYPGNSGSPLYDPQEGRVVGILNSVLVKGSKENVLRDPSAISYAIPIRHAFRLLQKAGDQGSRQ